MNKGSNAIGRSKKTAVTGEDLKRGWINEVAEIPLTDYMDKYKREKGIAPGKRVVIKWK